MLSRQAWDPEQNALPWAHFQIYPVLSKSDSNFFPTLFQRASVFHLSFPVSTRHYKLNSEVWLLQGPPGGLWWPSTGPEPTLCAVWPGGWVPWEDWAPGTEAGGPSDQALKKGLDSLKRAYMTDDISKTTMPPPPTWFPEKTKQRKKSEIWLWKARDKKQNV